MKLKEESNRKSEIIEKATELFYKKGYSAASIRDIVREVGITNATIYNYFKNKDEILFHIIMDIGTILLNKLTKIINECKDDPLKCLETMIFEQICLIKTKRKEIKIYMEEQFQLPDDLREKVYIQHRKIYNCYYDIICKLEEKKLIKDINKTVATFGIFAMINWTYRWYKDDGPLSIENIAKNIIELYFKGLIK